MQTELDAAMAPLNVEQARLNRARMLLYVKQFGPMRALFSATPPATKSLLWFPGDFEQPRNDGCDTPGACRDWADGAYIDSFAAATTNWDSMGQPTAGYLHWDTMAEDSWEGPADTVRDGGNPNVRWHSTHTQQLLEMPATVADEAFDWKGFNSQQLKLQQRAQAAAQVLMSPALQNFGPAQLLAKENSNENTFSSPARTSGLQVSGKGGWFETHSSNGSPLPSSAAGMLGVDEQWVPPLGLPFGGNIASRPLSAAAKAKAQFLEQHLAEASQAASLKAKLNKVQSLMDQQWTGTAPSTLPVHKAQGDGISAQLLDDLNAPLREHEQRQEAEGAARAAKRAVHQTLGMQSRQYGDIASLQKPVFAARLKRQVERATDAIDAALDSKIISHSDDPAAPGHRGTVHSMPGISGNLKLAGDAGAVVGPPAPTDETQKEFEQTVLTRIEGPEGAQGELSEVLRLKARLRRQRDANRRLETKLHTAREQGFGKQYGAQLQQTEERVADAVAKRLSPQVLKRAALEVAHKVAQHEDTTLRQSLGRKHSKGWESIHRECDGDDEWNCAETRVQNTGPRPMRMAGSDRFHNDEVGQKNMRKGDDQDINYRFPRDAAYPNRDGSKPMNAAVASKDAENADRNGKAAWAAAMSRDVRQGGGGDEERGEEVADDAPRYRWAHHRNLVFRKGASQNWAREHGSELPEQQQTRADVYDAAHAHQRHEVHISETTGGEPMWGRSRGNIKRGSMRGGYYDYSGRDKWPFARPVSDHWKYARRRAERAAMHSQKVEAAQVYPADENYDEETAQHSKFCHDSPEKCVPRGNTNDNAERRRTRDKQGIARGLYSEHDEKRGSPGNWHTRGTEEAQQRRNAHEPLTKGRDPLDVHNSTLPEGALGTEAGEGEVGAGEDDEPWEIRGSMSSTEHGQKHWQPHYFNHAFWSQLYHYFKGDKPSEYCNVCVGEFMTALQDIKDPSTGEQKTARAEQIPEMCQGVCESNQALGYKFHRRVPTAGQSEATMKRANLLQHVAETEDEREAAYKREYNAYVHAPPKEADYRVTRMQPTPEGARHAGVLRETSDLRRSSRRRYGDRGYAETNGGIRRYRTQSTRQVAHASAYSNSNSNTNSNSNSDEDMPVSAAVQLDLDRHASAATAAAAKAAAAAAQGTHTHKLAGC